MENLQRLSLDQIEAMLWDSWEKELAEKEFLANVRKSGEAPVLPGATPDHHQKQEF